jgi:hypothetical protein
MITIGTRLCTKDGRLIGNGIVVDILTFSLGFNMYLVKTDFGNLVTMHKSQIYNQFYIADDVIPPKTQLLAQLALLSKVVEMYYGD